MEVKSEKKSKKGGESKEKANEVRSRSATLSDGRGSALNRERSGKETHSPSEPPLTTTVLFSPFSSSTSTTSTTRTHLRRPGVEARGVKVRSCGE
jgi:hypothetical protein